MTRTIKRVQGGDAPPQQPLRAYGVGEIEEAEAALLNASNSEELPALAPIGSIQAGANDLARFTNETNQTKDPSYRVAFGRTFVALAGGLPRWNLAVRLISPVPLQTRPLRQALQKLGLDVPPIQWIGMPQLHATVSAKTLSRKADTQLRIGHSVRHSDSGDGTITLFFKLAGHLRHFMMTSGHVATNLGRGVTGDTLLRHTLSGRRVVMTTPIATLLANPEDAPPSAFPNTGQAISVDYAIAELLPDIHHAHGSLVGRREPVATVRGIGPIPLSNRSAVSKIGSGSGETSGEITAQNVRLPILDPISGKFIRYENQIEISPKNGLFSSGGDSGALVFTDHMIGVAMVNGGTSRIKEGGRNTTPVSFASPIDILIQALKADVQL